MARERLTPVFLYGSAKAKHSNHKLIFGGATDVVFQGRYTTDDVYYMIDMSSIPVCYRLYPSNPKYSECRKVVGEVYMVSSAILSKLDHLEGHPEFFKRETVMVNGKKTEMYIMDSELPIHAPLVKTNMQGYFEWDFPNEHLRKKPPQTKA